MEKLERTNINGKRYYKIIKDGIEYKYPSVTTILSYYQDKKWINEWKKRIGESEANKISSDSLNIGTILHNICEYYLNNFDLSYTQVLENYFKNKKFNEDNKNLAIKLFSQLYNNNYFSRIKNVIMTENYLYSDSFGGFAGTVDFIYKNVFDEIVIVDFKNSIRPKKEEHIKNYKLQVVAYLYAYYKMTNELPNKCEIWIINRQNFDVQIFELFSEEIKKYLIEFKRLATHYNKMNNF